MSLETLVWSLAIGAVAGWAMHRSHFCTMGAVSDFILFGSKTRLKAWLLAMAIAIFLTTSLRLAGLIHISGSIYLAPSLGWAALLLGGWLFGFGMVLGGGCAGRNLVRLGSGSLKALLVILVMSMVAAATSFGWLRWMPNTLDLVGTPDLHPEGLGIIELFGPSIGGGLGLIFSLAIAIYCVADRGLRASRGDLMVGIVLGLIVPLGWLVTGSALIQEAPDEVPRSLGYILPSGEILRVVTSPFGIGLTFGIVAWLGTLGGAFCSALTQRSIRFETFSNHDDMVRHLQGAALMGFGGVLAAGCTIGQGLAGTASLAPASFVALFAMFIGARRALRFMETSVLLGSTKRA